MTASRRGAAQARARSAMGIKNRAVQQGASPHGPPPVCGPATECKRLGF